MELSISSFDSKEKFKEIGFLQNRKNLKLNILLGDNKPHHTVSDIIPLTNIQLNALNKFHKIQRQYLLNFQNLGREYLQKIAPTGSFFNDISHSDVLWDKVMKIEKISKNKNIWVYDVSIPGYEKFICNNVLLHNTRELNIIHDNWLPSVARAGVGLANLIGQKFGEVSLFDLLKESFRQNPDYVIVGEVRGKEAYVLFQGMGSGHPSFGTMHANSVDTMIKRLETEPINLSPTLVESLDIVIVMSQTKLKGKEMRRVKEINEIISINNRGQATTNTPFVWRPQKDTFYFKTQSYVFEKLFIHHGVDSNYLQKEFNLRTNLLIRMYQRGIFDHIQFREIIKEYYKSPEAVLRRFGII